MNDLPEMNGYSDGDVDTNTSTAISLNALADLRYSRRQALFRGGSAIVAATIGGAVLAACDSVDADPDIAPTVNAGAAGSSTAGRVVTLAGTATDDGNITSVAWTQVSGPVVTLSGATTNNASFVAPAVATATPLVFQFAAVDNFGRAANATTTAVKPSVAAGYKIGRAHV